jgi:hypothetical protein
VRQTKCIPATRSVILKLSGSLTDHRMLLTHTSGKPIEAVLSMRRAYFACLPIRQSKIAWLRAWSLLHQPKIFLGPMVQVTMPFCASDYMNTL